MRVRTLCAAVATLCAVAMPAYAATIDVGQAIVDLWPYIYPIVGILLSALGGWLAIRLNKLTGIKISDGQWAVVHSAAAAAAGEWWARHGAELTAAKIDVGSPGIAAAANAAINRIPDQKAALGATSLAVQEAMEDLVVSKIGGMQAAAPVAAGAPPKAGG